MRTTTQILSLGTYERDYPRNSLTIAALRGAGFDVVEIHAPVWGAAHDKTTLLRSPGALLRLGLNLLRAYTGLTVRTLRRIGHADIVMFGYIGQLDVLVLGPALRLLGKPVVFNPLITLTDTLIDDRRAFAPGGVAARLIRLIDRLALLLANVILVDTAENGAYLTEQFGINPERIHVVPVGADEALFSANRSAIDVDDPAMPPLSRNSNSPPGGRDLDVLFYGNMIPLQGVDTIVRAARLLRGDDVRFEIIGTGQTLDEARALAVELGTDNIDWVGRVPYVELPRRIARADVVLGIFGDTAKAARVVPNKVYQAMAMGAAIVTRDSSAPRSMLTDGVSTLLVPPADPEALADAIRRLRDSELRARLGAAANWNFIERASLFVQSERLRDALGMIVLPVTGQPSESVLS